MFIVFNGRFPSEKAASLFAAKSAEEFARLGITVELIIPKRAGLGTDDPFAYYGISKNFTITYIPIIDFFRFPVSHNLAFKANYLLFSLCTALYLLTKQKDVIFSN